MQQSARNLRYGIFVADIMSMFVALLLAYGLRRGFDGLATLTVKQDAEYVPILVVSVIGWAVIYARMQLDGFRRGWNLGKVASEVTVGVSILLGLVAAAAFIIHDYVPRLVLLYYSAMLAVSFVAVRTIAHLAFQSHWVKPRRRLVILGNGRVARELSSKLEHHPEMLCEVVGFLYPSAMEAESLLSQRKEGVAVAALSVVDMLRQKDVTDIVIVLSAQRAAKGTLELVNRCREAGISVSLVPLSYELYVSRPALMDLDGLPIISLDSSAQTWPLNACKRLVDLAIAIPSLLLALPLLTIPAVYLRLRSGRAFRRELRFGKDGEPFWMYRLNVERYGSSLSKLEKILNDTSLSEAPQLFNVMLGDMSVVGPRPESAERVKHYSEWQRQRLKVHPGITGLAQVRGLRDLHSSEEKARFDLQYIQSWNPFSDCVLVLQTAWTLISRIWGSAADAAEGPALPHTSYPGISHADSAQSSAD